MSDDTAKSGYVHGTGGGVYIAAVPVADRRYPVAVNVKLAATDDGTGSTLWVDFSPERARRVAANILAAADEAEGVGS